MIGTSCRFARPMTSGILGVALSTLVASSPVRAWHADGHRLVSRHAARLAHATAPDFPAFFCGRAESIADASVEPDARRSRALPQLRSSEAPEHYIDLELLEGAELPGTRYEYVGLLGQKGLSARTVGLVPYAIVEATQHLALAFAEHRARPDDEFIEAKVLYFAGVLSHYAADMSQPLHTTIHHNGRALEDMSSPGTGIHDLVDSLFGRVRPALEPPPETPFPRAYPEVWTAVLEQLTESHSHVDRVYEMEASLFWDVEGEAAPEPSAVPGVVAEFTTDRLASAVLFTARLFAAAWRLSEDLELPGWVVVSPQELSSAGSRE